MPILHTAYIMAGQHFIEGVSAVAIFRHRGAIDGPQGTV